jgi:hypothetical protein
MFCSGAMKEALQDSARAIRSEHASSYANLHLLDGVVAIAQDLHPVLPHVWAAQAIQERGTNIGVLGGAALGCVLMPHNEQRHGRLLGQSACSA